MLPNPDRPLGSVLTMGSSAPGSIRIRLFASLREQAGWAERQWLLEQPTTAE